MVTDAASTEMTKNRCHDHNEDMMAGRRAEWKGDDRDDENYDGDGDDEEAVSLISNTNGGSQATQRKDKRAGGERYGRRYAIKLFCVTIGLGTLMVVLQKYWLSTPATLPGDVPSSSSPSTTDHISSSSTTTISWSCPVPLDASEDDVDVGKYIVQGDKYGLRDKNATELWEWMQTADVDGWGRTYQSERARIRDFKAQYYAPHFRKDKTIHMYESACGVGRSLLTTLDIVQEIYGGDDDTTTATSPTAVLYGNDYSSDSAYAANTLFGTLKPYGAQLGKICGGVDSTDLSHVPSNSFDIVYTGYVGLLHDPLGLTPQYPNKKIRSVYKHICRNATNDGGDVDRSSQKAAKKQVQEMNRIQEDWFAKWVSEMIRIAKPGSPVMVEEIPVSKCEDVHDKGGVSKDFWLDLAGKKYESWNQVDPSSIQFMQGQEEDGTERTRYNVAMMKKKEQH